MNIIEFLEEYDVKSYDSGTNVSTGWIGFRCPFCDDQSNHCGVRLSDLRCSCWKCGGHNIYKLISQVSGIKDKKKIKEILKELSKNTNAVIQKILDEKPGEIRSITKLPPEATTILPQIHKDYIKSRGFHHQLLQRKYDIMACNNIGKYKFRLIVPFYQARRLVSFTTRSIFNNIAPKYLNPTRSETELSPKEILYNVDNTKEGEDIIILEGVTDVWRFGDGAVSLGGIEYTQHQILSIIKKKPRKVFIMFDNDRIFGNRRKIPAANQRAIEICRILDPFVKETEIVSSIAKNDLGNFTAKEALDLRRILKFNQ